MFKIRTIASAAFGAFVGVAIAQIGNPAGMAPDTLFEAPGKPAANQTNTQDRLFAQLLAAGGLAEVELGKLAGERASEESVKKFAQKMIDDHTAAGRELASIASKSKIPLPDKLDPEHVVLRQKLEALQGDSFDLAYLQGQVVDHQKTVQLLEWEIGAGEDGELQRFASKVLPTVFQHLQMARDIIERLNQTKISRQ
jgi:putative membrane protein